MNLDDLIISLHYQPGDTRQEAELFASSLLRWGERFKQMPKWVFEIPAVDSGTKKANLPAEFHVFTPQIPSDLMDFPFASKVIAAAEAESHAEAAHARQLIWCDPDTIILHEPLELILTPQEKIALTPVHLRNISCLACDPLDEYWENVLIHCHVPKDQIFTCISMIDQKELYAHFNAGLISVNPLLGILRRWRDNFLSILSKSFLEPFYNKDTRYKIFIHQAVFSATILETCDRDEIKLLPPNYNFPLHLVKILDPPNRPACLDNLITARYDDYAYPGWSTTLTSSDPLRSWLEEQFSKGR